MVTIVLIFTVISSISGQSEWGDWSNCTKSCDIGTQQRQRNHNISKVTESQYCNLQFCDEDKTSLCFSCIHSLESCYDHTCHCLTGENQNTFNCYPYIGNCYIRHNPKMKIGYQYSSGSKYASYSCTTKDNVNYEVHMIGIKGGSSKEANKDYEITIISRGLVSKPVVLVLTSYEATNWIINSTIGLNKVLYGGFKRYDSTVSRKIGSTCFFKAELKYDVFGYGSTTDHDNTKELIKLVYDEFGPITSFTGFYQINTSPVTYTIFEKPVARIVIEVGGNPLQQLPDNYTYNADKNHCATEQNTTAHCPTEIPYNLSYSWTEWSNCSKPCDIGIRSRCRYNDSLSKMEAEDEYCNLNYCPDGWKKCSTVKDCNPLPVRISVCTKNRCSCTLGKGYNKNNCFPFVGNCHIRVEPVTALGYKDISYYYSSLIPLYSCTTNDNNVYELHVVGIYGSVDKNVYQVSLLSYYPIAKPIILVLSSYHTTHWKIHTQVKLLKVVYSGFTGNLDKSTVTKTSFSPYDFEVTKNASLQYGYGTDTEGGKTLQYITNVYDTYGPLTSFTGYYALNTEPLSHIIIKVGQSPLQVTNEDRRHHMNWYDCDGISTSSTAYNILLVFDSPTTILHSMSIYDVYKALFKFWTSAFGHFPYLRVTSYAPQTSTVNHTIETCSVSSGDLIVASHKLVKKLDSVMIKGYRINGRSIKITNIGSGDFVYMSPTSTDDFCVYLTTLTPCDTIEECHVIGKRPVCSKRLSTRIEETTAFDSIFTGKHVSLANVTENSQTIITMIVTACIVFVIILVILQILCFLRRRKKENTMNTPQNETYDEIPADHTNENSIQLYTIVDGYTVHSYDHFRRKTQENIYLDILE